MDSTKEKSKGEKLFADFPPVPTETWEAAIARDLKGADYERKLIWKTMEGFNVKPYYRAEHLKDLDYLKVFPGDFPFVRGNRKKENKWFVRQDIAVDLMIEKANKKALDILMKGVDSLGFVLDPDKKPAVEEIEKLMENIYSHLVEINFVCGEQAPAVFDIYLQLVKKYNRDLQKIHGSVDYSPLKHLVLKGRFYTGEEHDFETAKKLIEASGIVPNFRTLSVDASVFKNAGSSIVEELAFGLAWGSEYLTRLTDKGLTVDAIAPKIKFVFGTGSNYFMEIAKLRAARLLWAKIVNTYGPSHAGITTAYIHSVNTTWNKTLYDAHVNMLRTTTEAMSAIIGGTDSLAVEPYNAAFEDPGDFAERIARNQQLILKEESHFDKIVDPSAGSYYIENLTHSIATEAFKLFLETDEKGGFIQAFKNGFVQEKIAETARKRDMAIATRKEILLGTNQFPNLKEAEEKALDAAIFTPATQTAENALAQPLKLYRGAQAFEMIRYKTDQYVLQGNKRPQVFLFTYGNLAMRKARAQFTENFFGCAGFGIIDNNGFKTVDEGVKAVRAQKPGIVVICAADEDYPEIAPEIYNRLGAETIVVVAGYPKDSVEMLKEKGIRHFIHVKSNVLEALKEFQQMLKIV